jgi:hypothetical protein
MDAVNIITLVNTKTKHNWVASKLGNTVWITLEFACYIMLLALFALALYLPNGEIKEIIKVEDNITAETTLKIKELVQFFLALKIIIVVFGILMLVPATLFRKIRKKNNLLEELNDISGKFLKDSKTTSINI